MSKDDAPTIGQAASVVVFEERNTCLVEDLGIESPMEGQFYFDDLFCYALTFSYLGRARCHAIILQHAQRSSFL